MQVNKIRGEGGQAFTTGFNEIQTVIREYCERQPEGERMWERALGKD